MGVVLFWACDALNHTLAAHLCVFFPFFYEPFLRLRSTLVVTIYRLRSSEVNINRIMKQSLQSVLMMEEIRGVICGGREEKRKRTVGSCGWWWRRRIGCCVMICARHQTAQLPVQPWWHSAAESLMLRTAKKNEKAFPFFLFLRHPEMSVYWTCCWW